MTDTAAPPDTESSAFAQAALERHKREGMRLAVKARWIALAVVAAMLPFLNQRISVLYYEALLLGLAGVGYLQFRIGRVGRSRVEFLAILLDLLILTLMLQIPNPFESEKLPTATNLRFDGFGYFFILLAAGTLSYSWRTIAAIGNFSVLFWMLGVVAVWYFGVTDPELGRAVREAVGGNSTLWEMLNPNSVQFDLRGQEVVVFLIVAYTLALSVRRFDRLLIGNAELERERANLSRYFSPNMVEQLSRQDEPLKEMRSHDVAVLFVDIVGFTQLSEDRDPKEVITLLRDFHQRMEAEVFRFGGTLDKYLGDGLMATFGTPLPGEADALAALRCARSMIAALSRWNAERRASGEPEIRGSFGLHYGPAVLGDIGMNRLEFAVVGNTVNVSSRMEKLTRELGTALAMTDIAYSMACRDASRDDPALTGLAEMPPQAIRGLAQPVPVWVLRGAQ